MLGAVLLLVSFSCFSLSSWSTPDIGAIQSLLRMRHWNNTSAEILMSFFCIAGMFLLFCLDADTAKLTGYTLHSLISFKTTCLHHCSD